jgi:hypothetical protein
MDIWNELCDDKIYLFLDLLSIFRVYISELLFPTMP